MSQSLRKILLELWAKRALNGRGVNPALPSGYPFPPRPLSAEGVGNPSEPDIPTTGSGGMVYSARVRQSAVDQVGALQSWAPDPGKVGEREGLETEYGGPDFLFLTKNGTPYAQRNVQRAFTKACKGLSEPLPTFHDLRHTFASALISAANEENGGIVRVSRQLRHADVTITLRTYASEFKAKEKQGMSGEVIDRLFGEEK